MLAPRTSVHEKGVDSSEVGPNGEGRFDTSATSLTNSMTWIPLSTSVCCSLSREARRGEFPIARYPVACPCFVVLPVRRTAMQIVYERCAGLDVHKKTVVACLLFPEHGQQRKERQTFSTMTPDLVRLRDWLKEHDCTCVAMESTGVFWKPIYNLLEGHLEVMVVNAQHIKAVAGRKTDVKDAEWIADLLQHGLLRPSFIPPAPQRELRELTRYRSSLVADRARVINRIHKVLEDTNLKLTSVVTDVTG